MPLTFFGGAIFSIASVFLGHVEMPSTLRMWPRYVNLVRNILHFSGLRSILLFLMRWKISRRHAMCCDAVLLADNMSSRKATHLDCFMPSNKRSIIDWKNPGELLNPIGLLRYWKNAMPGRLVAV